ncbi:hypothetical protein BDR03DRAFT_59680 [Suillus americanus]|nr:hypothetical protein BDR03DRAFT_59680 [Suillus americanus]
MLIKDKGTPSSCTQSVNLPNEPGSALNPATAFARRVSLQCTLWRAMQQITTWRVHTIPDDREAWRQAPASF